MDVCSSINILECINVERNKEEEITRLGMWGIRRLR